MSAKMKWVLSLVWLCAAMASAAVNEEGTSKYTSTARGKSISFEEDADDPSGFRAVFRGLGGYDLEHLGGDERSWINVRFQGKGVDLYEATMEAGAATGAFPHKANDVVEWRGREDKGRFVPYALIYRIVGLDERGHRRKTRLLVIQLDGARSRIIGHADEPQADAKARELADRSHWQRQNLQLKRSP